MQNLLNIFSYNQTLFIAVIAFLGLMVGSFLNVVIYRVPKILEQQWQQECADFLDEKVTVDTCSDADIGLFKQCSAALSSLAIHFNLLLPPSHCPVCKKLVRPWQNIPVLSFILLRGKCADCKTPISWRYPAVEILTGILFAVIAGYFGVSLITVWGLIFTAILISLAFIDADTQLLPDALTIPLLWIGLLFNLVTSHVILADAVIGAVIGYLSLWIIFWLFKLVTGKEGMGYGDFKLLAALGAWLGWQQLPVIILISATVGALFGITMMVFGGKNKKSALPFGPYLASAGLIAFIWGNDIISWYLTNAR